jgi:hypothetical protein
LNCTSISYPQFIIIAAKHLPVSNFTQKIIESAFKELSIDIRTNEILSILTDFAIFKLTAIQFPINFRETLKVTEFSNSEAPPFYNHLEANRSRSRKKLLLDHKGFWFQYRLSPKCSIFGAKTPAASGSSPPPTKRLQ